MKGKLMLSSYMFYKGAQKLGYEVINIARMDVKGIDKKFIELAPSYELFKWYRANKHIDGWFDEYKKVYRKQLSDSKEGLSKLSEIKDMLDSGKNVCLVCFCNDVNMCHRSIIGDLFENKGYSVVK